MFNKLDTRISVPLMVFVLLFAAVGGAMAAWDTETTNTTTTSDVSGTTDTIVLDPGNETETTFFEVTASTENLTLEMTPAQPGVDWVAYSNSTPDVTDSTNGHYAFEISHDEWEDLPRDIDGGVYDVVVYNDDDGSVVAESEVTYDTSAQDGTGAIMAVTSASSSNSSDAAMTHVVADRLKVEEMGAGPFGISAVFGEKNVSTWSGYTTINGTSSPVEVHMDDADAAESYTSAAEDYDDGEWIREATVFANGVPVKLYMNEAPDDLADEESYAVWNNETKTLDVTLAGEEFEDVSTLQLRGGAGEGYGFGALQSNWGIGTALKSLQPTF